MFFNNLTILTSGPTFSLLAIRPAASWPRICEVDAVLSDAENPISSLCSDFKSLDDQPANAGDTQGYLVHYTPMASGAGTSITTSIKSLGLQEATKKSTLEWQEHLRTLFQQAKDRFPDVVWEVGAIEDDEDPSFTAPRKNDVEEVWGHKAIVYARAPPSFQSRYFTKANGALPYSSSPTGTLPTTSVLSLDVPPTHMSRTPSPYRSSSPAPSAAPPQGTLLRLSTGINPTLFSNELEYLYTGQGFGEAFEFLFDSSDLTLNSDEAEELRIDKLRKDLVFMWRSRLYSDVRLALTGTFSSSNHETSTAIFSSHRFILVSRSPYFYTALLSWPSASTKQQINSQQPVTLTLPSPPFTPASLHFTLGFIYTGTLVFSHRTYDLDTAFHIMRSATYLSIPSLYDEVQARIIQEMMHGLFHAFLEFPEYERLTAGAWGTGGCRCRQCARRAPRVLDFALDDDVKNSLLERGARRALVGLFGEGWCTSEFAALPSKVRDSLLRGVGKRTTSANAFPLLFSAEHALRKLSSIIDAWASEVIEMILSARKVIDDVICSKSEACFNERDWEELMERDGIAFEDGERVEWIMAAVGRGVNDKNAATLYQTLVSSILLRPHPTETDAPMLPPTSHIRVQVEAARVELLRWIGKRWIGIRQEGGFDELEGWAVKEISDHIEVALEDLLTPTQPNPKPHRSTLLRIKDGDSNDTISMHSSMRVSVLSRNLPASAASRRGTPSPSGQGAVHSGAGSARSTVSKANVVRTPALRGRRTPQSQRSVAESNRVESRVAKAREAEKEDNSRPDSKLTSDPSTESLPSYSSPYGSSSPTHQLPSQEPLQQDDDDVAQNENDDVNGDAVTENGDGASTTSSSPPDSINDGESAMPPLKVLIKKVDPSTFGASRTPRPPKGVTTISRPTSSAASTASVRSHASTIRKSTVTAPSGAATTSQGHVKSTTTKTAVSSLSSRSTTTASSRASLASVSSSRPVSSVSTTTDGATTFKTANTHITGRARKASTASTMSTVSVRGGAAQAPFMRAATSGNKESTGASTLSARMRKVSAGSTRSGVNVTPVKKPPVPPLDPKKLSPASVKRSPSMASLRSTTSTVSTPVSAKSKGAGLAPSLSKRSTSSTSASSLSDKGEQDGGAEGRGNLQESKDREASASPRASSFEQSDTVLVKMGSSSGDHKKSDSNASMSSNSTLKRRGSTDTIKTSAISNDERRGSGESAAPTAARPPTSMTYKNKEDAPLPPIPSSASPTPPSSMPTTPVLPRGVTLEIGIPCIISSKRKRFKAYARYIGEVEGEVGPWVGVEVPVGPDGLPPSALGGGSLSEHDESERQWHDGTWGGIRYFDIGCGNGSYENDWDGGFGYGYGYEDRGARRRRLDWGGGSGMSGMFGGKSSILKREGDQLNVERAKRFRSVSPAISDASGIESRGLFVRPQQVLYVVDAVGSDL